MSVEKFKRSDYKNTWSSLSEDYQNAVRHVTGVATEEALRKSGNHDAKRIIKYVTPTLQDTVLEVGCGIGRIGYSFADHCSNWTGCDISSNMLNFAQNRLSEKGNVELVELQSSDLSPFSRESFDVVYCSVVFMHLDEWDRYHYVLEAFRVLKPGGRFYFDNFDLNSEHGWKTFLDHKKISSETRPPHMSQSSTGNEFEAYLDHSEFQNTKVVADDQWLVGFGRKVS